LAVRTTWPESRLIGTAKWALISDSTVAASSTTTASIQQLLGPGPSSSPNVPENHVADVCAMPGRPRLREPAPEGYVGQMKLLRGAAALGIAKKVYTEARKPQNQARIKSAVAKARSRGSRPR
jgi:hypothetical protein